MVNAARKFIATLALLSVELIIILILFVLSLFAFFYITNDIFALKDTGLDTNMFLAVQPYISEANTAFMRFISIFGSHNFLLPANILLAVYFLLKKHRWYSIKVPVVSLGSFLVMSTLKLFFSRPRPDNPVYEAARGFSYPSGHAMSAITFFGLLIYLVWHHVKNLLMRWLLIILCIVFILLVGFSRIYLRVHYTSDVLAGFAMGVIWLVISLWVIRKIEAYTRREIAPEVNEIPNNVK